MAYIGARYCYFKRHDIQAALRIPISSLSVTEKRVQLSGLNQNKRILVGYDISISTPDFLLSISNTLGDLYWASSDYTNNTEPTLVTCFKINDVVFMPPSIEYQSKSDTISIPLYTLDGTSDTTIPIQMVHASSEKLAKQINLQGW